MQQQEYKKLLPNDCNEESEPEVILQNSETSPSLASRRARVLVLSGLLFFMFLIVGAILVLYVSGMLPGSSKYDVFKFQMPVKGSNGVMQHVHSSIGLNYVQYYIEVSPTEKTWIHDDFNTDLQVIRSESGSSAVCYVSKLDRSLAMAPTQKHPDYIPYKDHSHGVYYADEEPTKDKAFLGLVAGQLCDRAPVFWLHPWDIEEVSNLHQNMTDLALASSPNVHHRDKRNIKGCETSCCWLVCCCNTRHFVWESAERFTCKHICNKCTSAYKQKILKLC